MSKTNECKKRPIFIKHFKIGSVALLLLCRIVKTFASPQKNLYSRMMTISGLSINWKKCRYLEPLPPLTNRNEKQKKLFDILLRRRLEEILKNKIFWKANEGCWDNTSCCWRRYRWVAWWIFRRIPCVLILVRLGDDLAQRYYSPFSPSSPDFESQLLRFS